MSASHTFSNFDDFYSFYLSEHSNRTCRRLHFVGSTLGLMFLVTAIINGIWWLVIPGLLVGYAFAWFAHFFVEHNQPATFKYPLWSFVSDYKMIFYMLTGKMEAEVRRVSEK